MKEEFLKDLVTKAKNGDEGAKLKILEIVHPTIMKVCREYYIQGEELEDLVILTQISVLKAIKNFDVNYVDKTFYNYMSVVIRRTLQQYIRTKISNLEQGFTIYVEDIDDKVKGYYEDFTVKLQCIMDFKDFFYKLNEEEKKILIMKMNGMSNKDISKTLNLEYTGLCKRINALKRNFTGKRKK